MVDPRKQRVVFETTLGLLSLSSFFIICLYLRIWLGCFRKTFSRIQPNFSTILPDPALRGLLRTGNLFSPLFSACYRDGALCGESLPEERKLSALWLLPGKIREICVGCSLAAICGYDLAFR
jgi:hypothetical protein